MFNQNSSSNIGSALIVVVLLLVGLAGIAVAGASDADILNWQRSAAEAEQIRAITAWETQLQQMELPYLQAEREAQARIAAAQAEAELARIAAEQNAAVATIQENLRLQTERNNRRLVTEAWIADGLLALGFLLGLGLVVALTLAAVKVALRFVDRPAPPPLPHKRPATIPKRDPAFRQQQSSQPRRRERANGRVTAVDQFRDNVNGH